MTKKGGGEEQKKYQMEEGKKRLSKLAELGSTQSGLISHTDKKGEEVNKGFKKKEKPTVRRGGLGPQA